MLWSSRPLEAGPVAQARQAGLDLAGRLAEEESAQVMAGAGPWRIAVGEGPVDGLLAEGHVERSRQAGGLQEDEGDLVPPELLLGVDHAGDHEHRRRTVEAPQDRPGGGEEIAVSVVEGDGGER